MFRVITYNIGNGLADSARLISMLASSGADIIALQEVASAQGHALADALLEPFPHRAIYPLGIPGKAILSRFPLRDVELLSFVEGRPDLRAVAETSDGHIHVIVAHPSPPKVKRGVTIDVQTRQQLASLIAHATTGVATVMMGDFNAVAAQPTYRAIRRAGLVDAFQTAGEGSGLTLPTRMAKLAYRGNRLGNVPINPFMRVDYIWHSGHLRARSAWVGEHAGSDHLPVLAELERNGDSTHGEEAIVVAEDPAAQTHPIRRIWTGRKR